MRKRGAVTIWDGIQYRQVSREEATRLVDADMAQIMTDGLVAGTEMRFRKQFTGYNTRQVKAATPAKKKVAKKKAKKKAAKSA